MPKVLLRYRYGLDQRNDSFPGNNRVWAKVASYDEAVEEVRQALLALADPSPLPKTMPASATSLLYFDGSEEDGDGVAILWGEKPEFDLGETPSTSPTLVVDGQVVEIEDFIAVIDRDPAEADRLRAEQEAKRRGKAEDEEEDEDDEDRRGDFTLTLRYTDVPRSEVEHTAEDCTRNGDYPADSYDITED